MSRELIGALLLHIDLAVSIHINASEKCLRWEEKEGALRVFMYVQIQKNELSWLNDHPGSLAISAI